MGQASYQEKEELQVHHPMVVEEVCQDHLGEEEVEEVHLAHLEEVGVEEDLQDHLEEVEEEEEEDQLLVVQEEVEGLQTDFEQWPVSLSAKIIKQ